VLVANRAMPAGATRERYGRAPKVEASAGGATKARLVRDSATPTNVPSLFGEILKRHALTFVALEIVDILQW
jgi:hypothetical protein